MCGIAGIFNLNGEVVTRESILKMTNSMVNRGPDDEGVHSDGNFGFGMRRLSIIDVKGGHQPIFNEDKSVSVLLNGEIYNYKELRQDLLALGHVFRTVSDTEVIVHLYEEHGDDFVRLLNGMFGIAIWDSRRRRLLVARDRLGIKPVFIYDSTGVFGFGSDMRALRSAFSCSTDRVAVLTYLANSYIPAPRTIWNEFKKLAPGTLVIVDRGGVQHRRYWSAPAGASAAAANRDVRDELRALLDDSIALQLRSDVPVGLMLSGGLDSGTIAAIAKMKLDMLYTFTATFCGKGGEDSINAQSVAAKFGFKHTEINLRHEDVPAILEDLIPLMDEPIADSAIIPSSAISKAARERGIKVLLNGAGGDEIFGGYGRYFTPRTGSPTWVAENMPDPFRKIVTATWGLFDPPRGLRASSRILAWAGGVSGADYAFLKRSLRNPEDFSTILAELARLFGSRLQIGALHRAERGMRLDLATYLPDDVLALNDKTTMAASVEGRVPLLDHRLVEFALGLPIDLNLRGGLQKGLLRSIAKDLLPCSVLDQKKDGFSAPVVRWMEQAMFDSIREDILGAPSKLVADLFEASSLEMLMREAEKVKAASYTLLAIHVLNRWCRCHL